MGERNVNLAGRKRSFEEYKDKGKSGNRIVADVLDIQMKDHQT